MISINRPPPQNKTGSNRVEEVYTPTAGPLLWKDRGSEHVAFQLRVLGALNSTHPAHCYPPGSPRPGVAFPVGRR